MQTPRVTVRVEDDGVRVAVCSGEFDLHTSRLLVDACDAEPTPADLWLIDVRQVAFGDSSFLNALIQLRNTRPLALQGPLPSQVYRLMEMTGALPLFDVRDPAGEGPD